MLSTILSVFCLSSVDDDRLSSRWPCNPTRSMYAPFMTLDHGVDLLVSSFSMLAPFARVWISNSSDFRFAGTALCATIRPIDAATGLRFHGTARAQGLVRGHEEGSGGEHESRRIDEYLPSSETFLSLHPYRPNDVRVRQSLILQQCFEDRMYLRCSRRT